MDFANHVPGVGFQTNISNLENNNNKLIVFASYE
jgi:hypothetical protein